MTEAYPPMPWRLVTRGTTLATLHPVDVRVARPLVPPQLPILSVPPGWTVGGLFVTEYGPGSDLRYNELIVCAATVWYERRPCPWVTHLYVDSPESVDGGRRLLGVPKELARFERDEEGAGITVGEPARPICRFETGRRLWLWRQRLRMGTLHRDVRDPGGRSLVVTGNELRGQIGLARTRVEIPEASPLHPLRLGRPWLGGCGRDLELMLGGGAYSPVLR